MIWRVFKIPSRKLLFKMATQEDPKLTSSHRHIEFRDTCGQIFLLRKPKVRPSANKKETTWKQTYSLDINPTPRTASHNQEKTQNPEFLPKRKNFEPHIGHLTFRYLHLREGPPKALTLKANRAPILRPTGLQHPESTLLKGPRAQLYPLQDPAWRQPIKPWINWRRLTSW